MAVLHLGQITFEQFLNTEKRGLVAVLPVGATEAHGPHLPLATDVIIAQAMARAGSEQLSAAGITPVILPPIAYSVATYADGFAGTISISAETASAMLVDIAAGLARHEVQTLVIANAHLEPNHIRSIYTAIKRIEDEALLRCVFPDVTRKPWALRLTDEFKSGACHAGQYEGSIVLAERPELVRQDIARELPDNPASLSVAIKSGLSSFEAAGGPRAYFGSPKSATADEGRATIQTLGAILADATTAALS